MRGIITAKQLPESLQLETRIEAGWVWGPPLEEFFKTHCGQGFVSCSALKHFVRKGVGKPLLAAVEFYLESQVVVIRNSFAESMLGAFGLSGVTPNENRLLETWRMQGQRRGSRL